MAEGQATLEQMAEAYGRAEDGRIKAMAEIRKKDATIKEMAEALEIARSKLVEHEKYLDSKLAYDGVYKPSKTVCEIDAAIAKAEGRDD